MIRAWARSIGSARKPAGWFCIGGWERLVEQPVGVRAPAAALDQQVAGPLGEERPQVV